MLLPLFKIVLTDVIANVVADVITLTLAITSAKTIFNSGNNITTWQ